jgi:hypothetical protein
MHDVVRYVAEEEVTAGTDPDGTLGPSESFGQFLYDRIGRNQAVECGVEALDRANRGEGRGDRAGRGGGGVVGEGHDQQRGEEAT